MVSGRFFRPCDSFDSLRVFKTPDKISPIVPTLLWPKRATKLDGVPRPFVCFLGRLNAEW